MRKVWPAVFIGIGALLLGVLTFGAGTNAVSANLSHSYNASSKITPGNLVSLDTNRSNYVTLANSQNGAELVGVAVQSNESLLAVDSSSDKVQIATSGTVNTLVSNVNGDIKAGDKISVSPFSGVGMKAVPGSWVIGIAQSSFSSTSKGAVAKEVTDEAGQKQTIYLGYVNLTLGIGANTSGGATDLNGLQRFAKTLTGHTISTVRIVVAFAVALVALLSLVVLIYASIYGSIISVGRNPLARGAVYRTLASVVGMAVLIAAVATVVVIFILV